MMCGKEHLLFRAQQRRGMLNTSAHISLSVFKNFSSFLPVLTHDYFSLFAAQIVTKAARWPWTESRTPLVAWTGFRIDTTPIPTCAWCGRSRVSNLESVDFKAEGTINFHGCSCLQIHKSKIMMK